VATTARQYRLGGVFLRGRSTVDRTVLTAQLARLQRSARASGVPPLHIAVDQEGGTVQTLSGKGFPRLPAANAQGRWAPEALAAQAASSATALHLTGVTLNFAPVADTVAEADAETNPPIGALGRQYGSQPSAVADDVALVVRETQDAGVLSTLKHFPGLGRVTVNTDFSDRATDVVASPSDANLAPFAAGVSAGAAAVMMSSAHYPLLDTTNVASFSPKIIGLLRTDLGFTGLVVSDDLGRAVSVRSTPLGQRAVNFVAAGGDLVLSIRSSDARAMRQALVTSAASSPAFRRRLDEAALHVLESKVRVGILQCAGTNGGGASPSGSG
jgi:beta-N-acetylhexosaminidase